MRRNWISYCFYIPCKLEACLACAEYQTERESGMREREGTEGTEGTEVTDGTEGTEGVREERERGERKEI